MTFTHSHVIRMGHTLQDVPITSAITEPKPGQEIEGPTDEVTVKGYAWAGGGKGVVRVDVTADGGKSWVSAHLQHVPQRWSRWALYPTTCTANPTRMEAAARSLGSHMT